MTSVRTAFDEIDAASARKSGKSVAVMRPIDRTPPASMGGTTLMRMKIANAKPSRRIRRPTRRREPRRLVALAMRDGGGRRPWKVLRRNGGLSATDGRPGGGETDEERQCNQQR